jgi:hypothetical protein
MTKQHFIALAYAIKTTVHSNRFTPAQLERLADFCASQNPNFERQRWLDYITDKCGKNGGKL